MKQLINARRTGLGAMALVALLASLSHALPEPVRGLDYGPAAAMVERGEARLGQAGQEPVRRVRAAAMPYFSFAQSLRPRG